PGIDSGVTEEALSAPALPNEAPRPGSPASTRKTWWPSRSSQLAAHTPTMPAPMTPTRIAPISAIGFSGPARDLGEAEPRQPRPQPAALAVADVQEEIRKPAPVREERGIHLGPVEPRHRAAIEPVSAQGQDEIGALQRAVAKGGLVRQRRVGGEPLACI